MEGGSCGSLSRDLTAGASGPRGDARGGRPEAVGRLFLPFIRSPSLFLLPGTRTQSPGLQQPPCGPAAEAPRQDGRSWDSSGAGSRGRPPALRLACSPTLSGAVPRVLSGTLNPPYPGNKGREARPPGEPHCPPAAGPLRDVAGRPGPGAPSGAAWLPAPPALHPEAPPALGPPARGRTGAPGLVGSCDFSTWKEVWLPSSQLLFESPISICHRDLSQCSRGGVLS